MNAKTKKILNDIPEAKTQKRGGKDVMVIENLPAETKAAIDTYVATGTAVKTMQDQMDRAKANITQVATTIQDSCGVAGSYSKSYRLVGDKHELTFTRNDTFQVPKDVNLKQIAEATGKEFAKENFTETIALAINSDTMQDPKALKALLDLLKEHDLLEYFTKEVSVKALPGLDVNQFKLDPTRIAALRELGVKQTAGGLKA